MSATPVNFCATNRTCILSRWADVVTWGMTQRAALFTEKNIPIPWFKGCVSDLSCLFSIGVVPKMRDTPFHFSAGLSYFSSVSEFCLRNGNISVLSCLLFFAFGSGAGNCSVFMENLRILDTNLSHFLAHKNVSIT